MTDPDRFEEILCICRGEPIFSLAMDELSIDITVNEQKISYKYRRYNSEDNKEEVSEDLHVEKPDEVLDWDHLDEKMVFCYIWLLILLERVQN